MAVVNPPGGKTAITDYEILATDAATLTALVLCHLHTGRTHQIRVHLHHKGAPARWRSDLRQTRKTPNLPDRLMLHAWRLSFDHPSPASASISKRPSPRSSTAGCGCPARPGGWVWSAGCRPGLSRLYIPYFRP